MEPNQALDINQTDLDVPRTVLLDPKDDNVSVPRSNDGQLRASPTCNSTTIEVLSTVSLTLSVWTFIILYLILFLIHHVRRMQYFSLYDKCTNKNAHFQYDFHMICGRHSINFNRTESIMIDLLDNHSISAMSIQIPGSNIFNNSQMFMYQHSRSHLRCVQFTIYRRNPIKEVKCIRIAHSCSNPDSRLYVYGLDLHDNTNNETKFFPIASVVKYRGTHWALSTTFESKPDVNFKKLGVECYDPFGYSNWPIYLELHTCLLFIWCASFFIGHLFSDYDLTTLIIITMSIVATLSATICIVYLRLIKSHIVSGHYDADIWRLISILYLLVLVAISFISVILVSRNRPNCTETDDNTRWLTGSVASAILLTVLTLFAYVAALCRRSLKDSATYLETDANLARTNSKEGIQFVNDPTQNMCASFLTSQETSNTKRALERARNSSASCTKVLIPRNSKSLDRKAKPTNTNQGTMAKRSTERQTADGAAKKTEDDETLDTAFNHGSQLLRVKNRNSISQYV